MVSADQSTKKESLWSGLDVHTSNEVFGLISYVYRFFLYIVIKLTDWNNKSKDCLQADTFWPIRFSLYVRFVNLTSYNIRKFRLRIKAVVWFWFVWLCTHTRKSALCDAQFRNKHISYTLYLFRSQRTMLTHWSYWSCSKRSIWNWFLSTFESTCRFLFKQEALT